MDNLQKSDRQSSDKSSLDNQQSMADKKESEREHNIKQALAIVRLEGQEPGPNALAVLEKYRDGNITHDKLEILLREAALKDLTAQHDDLNRRFPTK
ncbi:hypothetical protein PT276_09675 [Orbaceae bacterium ESL0721]|nr:hypothetical protein [Orbaceae bacterium ESL0721]